MGLFSSKQKSSSNSTQQTSAWSPVQPALETGAGLMNSYLNRPGSAAVYSGPRVANLSGDTQAGLNMMRQSQGANDAYGFFKDIMTGGGGADVFRFAGQTGADRITDFRDGEDLIDLAGPYSLAAQADDTVIRHGGGTIILPDITPDQITAADFL